MKLVDVKCQNESCKFPYWEMEFDDPYMVANERCPACDKMHVATLDVKMLEEYLEED